MHTLQAIQPDDYRLMAVGPAFPPSLHGLLAQIFPMGNVATEGVTESIRLFGELVVTQNLWQPASLVMLDADIWLQCNLSCELIMTILELAEQGYIYKVLVLCILLKLFLVVNNVTVVLTCIGIHIHIPTLYSCLGYPCYLI